MSRSTSYRNHAIESRASFDGVRYVATFSIVPESADEAERITRICEGAFATEEAAHAAASAVARKLVDVMMQGADGRSSGGPTP